MKVIAALVSLAAMATAAPASPIINVSVAGGTSGAPGIFGQGSNLVSNIFDSAACLVSNVIGGGNPNCRGQGVGTTGDGIDPSTSVAFSYSYSTNQDGTLKVKVSLKNGKSCTYDLKADGKLLKDVIADAGHKCAVSK
ncbi:hypothetical protein RJ55_04488 [Drechmeria coniospora]|nr:hypothetical protein RJ55_04488 [Drechmeria coniospora]